MNFPADVISFLAATLSWRSILDIALLTAALLVVYQTLRRTGAMKIALGIVVATSFFAVARGLDLRGMTWLFEALSPVALIAVIVIFQPEIRRIFETTSRWKKDFQEAKDSEVPHILGAFLQELSRKRWGGIIVIPGRDSIERWTTGGSILEGVPSFSLLMSIFDTGSPGHDGAAVIEGGRVTRFGVRLPLSQGGSLPAEYGTRHHAALGLSENTDALVLVASEERGTLSAFRNGEQTALAGAAAVEALVREHWGELGIPARRGLRGTNPRQLLSGLALSAGVAFFIWYSVVARQSEMSQVTVSVPVEYELPPRGLHLSGKEPAEVILHLAGPVAALAGIDLAKLPARVDLGEAAEGSRSVVLTDSNFRLPQGLRILAVDPPEFQLTLEATLDFDIPVKPQLVGALGRGLELRSVQVLPEFVRVREAGGWQNSRPHELLTTPVFLGGIRADAVLFCKIVAPPGVEPLAGRWPDVRVTIVLSGAGPPAD